jgi:cytochrome P450
MTTRPIPEPDSVTSLRSLEQLIKQRNLLSALRVFHRELGDVFRISLPGLQTIMLAGPEANRFVLVEAREKLHWRTESDPVTTLLRDGVLVTDGEAHDALRGSMNQPLHKRSLTAYVDTMQSCTDRVIDQWSPHEPIDMLVEMRKVALMILTETLFKVDMEPDMERMWQPVLKTIQYISPGLWIFWKQVPRLGYKDKIREMNEYLYEIIDTRRATINESEADDLLGILISSGMNNDLIRDQVLTMLIAGHDTSTALLAWALYLLTTHPEVMEQVKQEVDTVLGSTPPTIDNINGLSYLGQVIDETLRMYPPIHLGSRNVTEDLEFDGYHLPAGIRLMYSIYLTHHDPKYWDDPDTFNPDRFAKDKKRKFAAYSYLPFGGGARNCIGTAFALVESKVILARIIQRYDLQYTGKHMRMKMGATLEPHPNVMVKVNKRVTG